MTTLALPARSTRTAAAAVAYAGALVYVVCLAELHGLQTFLFFFVLLFCLSRTAAAVAYAGALVYVVCLAVLHGLQPHMIHQATISKYALGRDGWLLQAAFVSAGAGYAGLARLTSGRAAIVLWLTAAAFVVMGAFRIDAVGPTRIASVHGALHTISFFVVVLLVHPLMFVHRRRFRAPALRAIPFVAPVLVVAGFLVPGMAGALLFRAWTLSLVVCVVVAERELDRRVHV